MSKRQVTPTTSTPPTPSRVTKPVKNHSGRRSSHLKRFFKKARKTVTTFLEKAWRFLRRIARIFLTITLSAAAVIAARILLTALLQRLAVYLPFLSDYIAQDVVSTIEFFGNVLASSVATHLFQQVEVQRKHPRD